MLLTAGLIAASFIISIVVIRVGPVLAGRSQSQSPPDLDTDIADSDTAIAVEAAIPAEKPIPPVAAKPAARPVEKPKPTAEKAPAVKPESSRPVQAQPVQTPAGKTPAVQVQAKPAPQLPPKPAHKGTVVIVIDDAGNNLQELEPFLSFPGPLTIAVLPGLPHSAEAARRIRAAGKEVFLHQPMEAAGGKAPGPGAIYADMDSDKIRAVLRQNIAEIGPVAGLNNHQGSKITADRHAMDTVLAFCREQKICFLDSRTTPETTAPAAARDLEIKIGERNIFIDNEPDRNSMNAAIQNGLTLAAARGSAVMIGHASSPELAPLLADIHRGLIDQGYTFSTAADHITK